MMRDRRTPRSYRIVDPRTGKITATGRLEPDQHLGADPAGEPRLVIFHDES
jgi:hypothetical protein